MRVRAGPSESVRVLAGPCGSVRVHAGSSRSIWVGPDPFGSVQLAYVQMFKRPMVKLPATFLNMAPIFFTWVHLRVLIENFILSDSYDFKYPITHVAGRSYLQLL